jgi:hypothetical protein
VNTTGKPLRAASTPKAVATKEYIKGLSPGIISFITRIYTKRRKACMNTQCTTEQALFQGLGTKKVVGCFDGGNITSDAGALLLREIDQARNMFEAFFSCFVDYRDQRYVEHTLKELIAQRMVGMCLGYEDVNDHDELARDPLLATVCGFDHTGADRRTERDRGSALAGKSTLKRMEKYGVGKDGYFDCYCYLPLYIFCGDEPLYAKLKEADVDPGNGSVSDIQKLVERIREWWPEVRIVLRGESGFCRDGLMSWCERNGVLYVFGLAKNTRLRKRIEKELKKVRKRYYQRDRQSQKIYKEFYYRTLNSWSRRRRVIGKAEYVTQGENPRFVVSNLEREARKRTRCFRMRRFASTILRAEKIYKTV